jgi:hypothetical protein
MALLVSVTTIAHARGQFGQIRTRELRNSMLEKTGRAFPRLNPRTIGKFSVLKSADAHEISVYICERAKTQDGRFPLGRLGPSWVQGEELADRTLLL